MPYESFIICDREGCNSRTQVPQLNAVPPNWIQLGYAKPNLATNRTNGKPEAIILTLCSWKCLLKYAKDFVRKEDEVEA